MAAKLWLVRHADTALNQAHRIRGWSNPPIDSVGEQHVHTLAKELKSKGVKPDVLVASDLQRAVETAKILGKALGIASLKVDWHFRPWNVGDFTGEESEKAHPQLMKYVKDRFSKVPGGESFESFDLRFMSALESLLKEHENENVMLVTHHRGDRVVDANLTGTFRPEVMNREGIDPAHYVEYNHKGGKISKL